MYIFVIIYYDYNIEWKIIFLLPMSIFITTITTFGLGVFISALNVKYRDFRYVIPFLIQLLLFITPVIYPITIIPYEWVQNIFLLNPLAGAIDLLRSSVTHSPIDWQLTCISTLSAGLIFLGGLFYFRKTEYYFADLA